MSEQSGAGQRINPIRILIIDDHAVVRAGISMLLECEDSLEVIGQAGNREDALALAGRLQPDVVLLDLDMGKDGSATEFMPDLRRAAPHSRILILTGVQNSIDHNRAVHLGAVGLVLKDQVPEVLIKAIQKVHAGEAWLDHKITASFISGLAQTEVPEKPDPEARKLASLTPREREVVTLLAEGHKISDIAGRLFISKATVRNHIASIYSKLEVTSRFELSVLLFRHGSHDKKSGHNFNLP